MDIFLLIAASIMGIDGFLKWNGREGIAQIALAGAGEQVQRVGGAAFYIALGLAFAIAAWSVK